MRLRPGNQVETRILGQKMRWGILGAELASQAAWFSDSDLGVLAVTSASWLPE